MSDFGREVSIKLHRADVIRQAGYLRTTPQNDLPDQSMKREGFSVCFEILVHHEFLKRKKSEVDVRLNSPAFLVLNPLSGGREKRLKIIIVRNVARVRKLRQ